MSIIIAIGSIYLLDFSINCGKFKYKGSIFYIKNKSSTSFMSSLNCWFTSFSSTRECDSLGRQDGRFGKCSWLFHVSYTVKRCNKTKCILFRGYIDLVKYFPFFGNTQLKVLCILAIIVLLLCDFVTCYTVREKAFDKSTRYMQKYI